MHRRLHIWIRQPAIALCLLCCAATAGGKETALVDSLLQAMTTIKADTGKVNVLMALAAAYRQGQVTKEFYYANEALSLAEKAGWDKGKMNAERLIGDCYYRVTAYNEAVQHFNRSVALARKLKRTDVEIACLGEVVKSCFNMNKLEEMVAYQRTVVELTQQMGDPVRECRQMDIYALRLSDAGHYKEALEYWQQLIAFINTRFTGQKRDELLSVILNTMSNTYVKLHEPDSALYYLRIAATLNAPTDDYYNRAYINSTICDVYESIHRDDSAEIYGERTVKMGEVLKNLDLQRHYCGTLSRVYEEDHKPVLALLYLKKYDSLDNLITDKQEVIDQALQVTKINLEQAAERNKLEKRSFEAIKRNKDAALIAALTALAALIALTIFIYRNLSLKKKANKTISLQAASLQEQNEIIDKALKEKEVLLKETHHRVKNNLQLISSLLELQAANIEDENAKKALRIAQDRVLSIATVHSKLYGNADDEDIEFSAFITDLFNRLTNAFAGEGKVVQFKNEVVHVFLPLNNVVLLGLILNELITNSFKYAFADAKAVTISISLEYTGDNYTLRYYDSGPGLPDGIFNENSGSLGLYIVRRLSKQLKGTVAYKFEAGSIFTINFPYAGD